MRIRQTSMLHHTVRLRKKRISLAGEKEGIKFFFSKMWRHFQKIYNWKNAKTLSIVPLKHTHSHIQRHFVMSCVPSFKWKTGKRPKCQKAENEDSLHGAVTRVNQDEPRESYCSQLSLCHYTDNKPDLIGVN